MKGLDEYPSWAALMGFEEIIIWVISSFLLGLIMSLKIINDVLLIDNGFFLMSAFAFIMLFIFMVSQKLVAWWLDCKIKIKWISFRQYWFDERFKLRWSFPLWLIIPLLLSLLTLNFVKWLAIFDFDVEPKESRVRRRWYDLTEMDITKIAVAGPIACIAFTIILKALGLSQFAIFPALLAFLTLIPIGQGLKVLMGSRIIWIFLIFLSFFVVLLTPVASTFSLIVIALLFAIAMGVSYYVLWEK